MSDTMKPREEESIRPSLKLAATLVFLAIALLVSWFVVSGLTEPASPRAHGVDEDDTWFAWEDPEPYQGGRRLGEPVAASQLPDGGIAYVTDPEHDPMGERRDRPDPQLERSIASLRGVGDGGLGEFPTLERTGRVTSVSGDSPVAIGASCAVRVLPVLANRFNCMVRVICDGVLLYPDPNEDAGYVACNVVDGQPSHAADVMASYQDTDPKVEVDLDTESVKVGDEDGSTSYLASIQLDRPRWMRRRRL